MEGVFGQLKAKCTKGVSGIRLIERSEGRSRNVPRFNFNDGEGQRDQVAVPCAGPHGGAGVWNQQ
jgi:hypothetical protein